MAMIRLRTTARPRNSRGLRARRPLGAAACRIAVAVLAGSVATGALAGGQDVDVPEVPVLSVSPSTSNVDTLVEDWEKPRRPGALSGRERQAILQQVSGGGPGGLPVINNIQTQGRTPTLRQAILTVKRPWYNHRAFLSAEGVQRVDARSVMRFDESIPGRAIVGMNLQKDTIYLIDFLVQGKGEGDYVVVSDAGVQTYPDADAKLNHVLLAVEADKDGWTEVSLSRSAGAFDLHTVEITQALGPQKAPENGGK